MRRKAHQVLLRELICSEVDCVCRAGSEDDGGHAPPQRPPTLRRRDLGDGVRDSAVDGHGRGLHYLHTSLDGIDRIHEGVFRDTGKGTRYQVGRERCRLGQAFIVVFVHQESLRATHAGNRSSIRKGRWRGREIWQQIRESKVEPEIIRRARDRPS